MPATAAAVAARGRTVRVTLVVVALLAGTSHAVEAPSAAWSAEVKQLRAEVTEMFYHSYDGYLAHAFPHDELRPLSCSGADPYGGLPALTVIDALDTLAVLGNTSEFQRQATWLVENASFDLNTTVSVFETNIRVVGGLLSAHHIAERPEWGGFPAGAYDGGLLRLAEDVARRLLPAFDTATGIPYGVVNLRTGVPPGETPVTSTAGGGTFACEWGVLSRLTGDPIFDKAARRAARALFDRRSALGLVGNHINTRTGAWTHQDAGVGAGIDSYYESLWKASLLFGDQEYLDMFEELYTAAERHLRLEPWYVEAHFTTGTITWPVLNALSYFWPGLQAQVGDVEKGVATANAIHGVWRQYGVTPEGYNLKSQTPQAGQLGYPLRPEFIESLHYLWQVTGDPWWQMVGRDVIVGLQKWCRAECGFAGVKSVLTHEKEDRQESFFLAETLKYAYLLYAEEGHWLVEEPFIFNTEAHPLPQLLRYLRPVEGGGGKVDEEDEGTTSLEREEWGSLRVSSLPRAPLPSPQTRWSHTGFDFTHRPAAAVD